MSIKVTIKSSSNNSIQVNIPDVDVAIFQNKLQQYLANEIVGDVLNVFSKVKNKCIIENTVCHLTKLVSVKYDKKSVQGSNGDERGNCIFRFIFDIEPDEAETIIYKLTPSSSSDYKYIPKFMQDAAYYWDWGQNAVQKVRMHFPWARGFVYDTKKIYMSQEEILKNYQNKKLIFYACKDLRNTEHARNIKLQDHIRSEVYKKYNSELKKIENEISNYADDLFKKASSELEMEFNKKMATLPEFKLDIN